MKDKNIAGILALFLGWAGIHRFYLGQPGLGIFYLILAATGISFLLGVIDAIAFFGMDVDNFNVKYNKDFYRATPKEQRGRTDFDRDRRYYYDRNMRRQQDRQERSDNRQQRRNVAPQSKRSNEEEKASGIRKFKDYEYEGAIADFEKALKINPRDVAVHFNLACTYSLMENVESAFFHLDKAVAFGFNDTKRIKEHDALAYLRIQPEFEEFEKNGFRLAQQEVEIQQEEVLDLNSEDLLKQLQRLGDLREKGLLTEEEFAAQKKKLLS
ncbi:MAG: NINE protein [Saprospiraceae bacterium]|nr:NINE protein [Saprospiraceae bacterium]